jgi:hypothetical protein
MHHAPLDPRIGMLVQAGRNVFYAYAAGYDSDPVSGSLNEIEQALGLPLTPSTAKATTLHLVGDAAPEMPATKLKRYAVTVTPSVTLYCSGQTFGESIEHVYAESRTAAIRDVRERVREANGRYGPKITYSARLDP